MGYDSALLLASIIDFLPLLAVATLVVFVGRRFGIVPTGGPTFSIIALLVCFGYCMIFLWSAFQMLVLTPSGLQQHYLGNTYASALALRSYDHQGFMDPSDEWIYALSPAAASALRRRCTPAASTDNFKLEGACILFSGEDERWFAEVTLSGDRLRILDGLH